MSEIKRLPIATLCLIGLSIVAAFVAFLLPDLLDQVGFQPTSPSALAVVACLFFHANLIHLLGNMVFLAAVGPAVEFALGAWRFLVIFIVGGVAGVLVHWIFTMNMPNPPVLIGGSGAIAACVAYFSVRYISLRVPLAPHLSAPIWSIALLWVGLQALGAVVRIGDSGGVAFWAHLGGFATGILLSLFFQAPKLATVQFGHDVLDQMNARSPAASLAAAENHLKAHPGDIRAMKEIAEAHRQLGHHSEECQALLEWLKVAPNPQEPLSRLSELGQLQAISPLQRTRFAGSVERERPDLARKLLQSIVDMNDDEPQKPDAMLALAELDRSKNEASSNAILSDLESKFPFHAATEIARAKGWIG